MLRTLFSARIIPQRIEHWIKPEQRRSKRRNLSEKFSLLFRREGGDELFETRIATKSIPVLLQLQRAVGQTIR